MSKKVLKSKNLEKGVKKVKYQKCKFITQM